MEPQNVTTLIPQNESTIDDTLPKNKKSFSFKTILLLLCIIVVIEGFVSWYYLAGKNTNNDLIAQAPISPSASVTPVPSSSASPAFAIAVTPTAAYATPTIPLFSNSDSPTPFPTGQIIKPTTSPSVNVLSGWQLYMNTQDHFSIQASLSQFNAAQSTPDDIAIQATGNTPLAYFAVGYLLSNESTACSSDADAKKQLDDFVQQSMAIKPNDKFTSSTTTILGRTITGVEEDASGTTPKGGSPYPNHYYYYLCTNNRVFYNNFTVNGDITVTNAQKPTVDSILATLNTNH